MEEAWELAALDMVANVNYRASSTRLRYQLVLSALVFCLGATYGVKELKVPGVLTFNSSPNTNLILYVILGFSIFTLFHFAVQNSLSYLQDPSERKKINEFRRKVGNDVNLIVLHLETARAKLDVCIKSYSNLPEKKLTEIYVINADPKPIDTNWKLVTEFVDEVYPILSLSKKILEGKFVWSEFFSGEDSVDKNFFLQCKNVQSVSHGFWDSIGERRIGGDKINESFEELSLAVNKLKNQNRNFQSSLRSFSDARWLDRRFLPFLVPVFVWFFLISIGSFNLHTKVIEEYKPHLEQQTACDEMGKS